MEVKAASKMPRDPGDTRRRLVEAAVESILLRGFAATSVDAICAAAGVTKGAFFHHFGSKLDLGLAVIEWWSHMGNALYAEAWKDPDVDPLRQLHAMFDIMEGFTELPDEPCVCAVGMMAQELAATHPVVREHCARELGVWTENVARLLAAARERHRPVRTFDPVEVAWFLNSLWQGSMLVGKALQSPEAVRRNLSLARDFVDGLFET